MVIEIKMSSLEVGRARYFPAFRVTHGVLRLSNRSAYLRNHGRIESLSPSLKEICPRKANCRHRQPFDMDNSGNARTFAKA